MIYTERCAGSSEQCTLRLSEKSIENVEHFLEEILKKEETR